MRIHKSITKESLKLVISALMECGSQDAPVVAAPGTYHGRPAVIIAVHDGESVLAPLAVLLDPDSDDAAYLTIDGATSRGGEAPSAPSGVSDDAALAVLRDLAANMCLMQAAHPTLGVLAERAQRVLAGKVAAPAAPVHTGVYL